MNAKEIEAFARMLDEPMKRLESEVMADIIRRIKINGEITRAADWQIYRLHELGMSKRAIKKLIKEALKLTPQEINHLFKDIIRKGYAEDEQLYKYKGKPYIPFEENKQLQQLITATAQQTYNEMKNITQSLGFAVRQPDGTLKFTKLADYYQQTLDKATLSIATGAFDYNTVLKKAVAELTNSGLRTVNYETGWSNRVEVATRRAVMTGIGQITGKICEQNAEILGTDMFEVTWHGGARPSHQVWQGKWYTMEQLKSVCGYGTVTGLKGANCYHDFYPVDPDVDEPTYTEEQLAKMNEEENTPVEYKGKKYTKYEALQRQRKLETTMRAQRQKIKLLKEGGADEDDIIIARGKYRVTSSEYTRFSEAMNLPQQRERVTIDGLKDIGKGKYKTDLTNKSYNDILYMKGKMSDLEARKWYKAHDKTIPDLIDKTLPIEEQAKQACELRNMFRTQTRNLMANQEKRKELDISDPNKSFEELIADKMSRKGLSRSEAIEDVLKTATKTRKSVDRKYGLE
jgi:hypothetical protein